MSRSCALKFPPFFLPSHLLVPAAEPLPVHLNLPPPVLIPRHVSHDSVVSTRAQVSYSIAVAEPLSVHVDTYGSGVIPDADILKKIKAAFDFRWVLSRDAW